MKVIIETDRLLLREFELSDAPEMFLLNSDHEVIKYTGDVPFKNIEEAEQLILNYEQYSKYGFGRWTVLNKSTGAYLGWCGLKFLDDLQETDIGYRFHKKYWGRGYATESAAACLKYGLEKLQLKKIIGRAMKENYASIKVMEKTGMKFERNELMHEGAGVIYSIEKINQT